MRSSLFGTLSGAGVGWRLAVDFGCVSLSLVMASLGRLVLSRELTADRTLGAAWQLLWSSVEAVGGAFLVLSALLLCLSRLYRPVPSARVGARLRTAAAACACGLILQLVWNHWWRAAGDAQLTVAGAWTLLFACVSLTRISRMYVGSRCRVMPRHNTTSRVEDVLVVGGAGYIGSVLTRQLLAAGYRVRVLDLELFGFDSLASVKHHPRLELVKGDFRNVADVVGAMRGMDAVVHLAAIVGDPACAIDEQMTITINYHATKHMAQLARANRISRFVFTSTCSVYGSGGGRDVVDEASPLHPVSLYATTKIDAERALLESADEVFRPTILRFGTAYGWSYRPRFDLVANLLSAKGVTEGKITVFNGHYWRPFVHTRDMARSIRMVLEAPLHAVGGEIFNVGDNEHNFTLRQLGDLIAEAVPGATVDEARNDEDPRDYRVRFDKIRDRLGFRAQVSFAEGIREMIDALRAGQVHDWKAPIYSNQRHMESDGLHILRADSPRSPQSEELLVTRRFLQRAA